MGKVGRGRRVKGEVVGVGDLGLRGLEIQGVGMLFVV